jgi:hypothetical protein
MPYNTDIERFMEPLRKAMKKVLVVQYSQTGQLTDIVTSILSPLTSDKSIHIDTLTLQPRPAYPFPWTTQRFCDVFPESVEGVPCGLAPLDIDPEARYDLIVLAYTVWYLSPSLPVQAFLRSPEAAKLFPDTPVVTVIGCRNMWLLAQDRVKQRLQELDAHLVGNIVLGDRAGNLVGVATIAYWMLTGRKERLLHLFPRPGVDDTDIRQASRFGIILRKALQADVTALDQEVLNAVGAVRVEPAYIIFEHRIMKIFRIWARFIRKKGGPGAPDRQRRVLAFFFYLLTAIAVLAPLASLAAKATLRLRKARIEKAVAYYRSNRYEP